MGDQGDTMAMGQPHNPNFSSANTSARASSSPLRQRPLGRAPTFAEVPSPLSLRRSSTFSDSIDGARQSILSSTDDLLLPKVKNLGLGTNHEPSHWHSIPLALALLPALGGLLFHNGSAVVTDITLLGLAAVFLNWSVRLPWDWYSSAQSTQSEDPHASDVFYPEDTIIEERDEDEQDSQTASPASKSKNPLPNPTKTVKERSPSRNSAAFELRLHEILALLACFLFPVLGGWLLHTIRSQLSRPSEGLVSNYNLTVFLLASELRPLSHLVKLIQYRTLHLQRTLNPSDELPPSPIRIDDLSKRLDELEAHIADTTIAISKSPTANDTPSPSSQITAEVRKSFQPDLDALNRAVRRYEKRATLLTMQTESRLQDLEARMSDAITLAAAAERSNKERSRRNSSASVLLDWICAIVVLPMQAMWAAVSFPLTVGREVVGLAEGYVGRKVRREMRTAGKVGSGGEGRRGEIQRGQGRAGKKAM